MCIRDRSSAGFRLSKWCSNHPSILQGISIEHLEKQFPLYFGNEHVVKTLGLMWFPSEDAFRVWVRMRDLKTPTKRQVLSIISAIFDPLRFLSPITIVGKILMQSLWKPSSKGLSWDDRLPDEINKKWWEFSSTLGILNDLSIPRHIFPKVRPDIIEIHGFADASERAYGAVIYVRSVYEAETTVRLFYSKTRVAPLKERSIHHLELCAALLLSEIVDKVSKSLQSIATVRLIRLWSDNEATLTWINSPPSRWQVFVANRTKKIQVLTKDCIWDYVKSADNPADLLSRGILSKELLQCDKWWHGPKWLSILGPFSLAVTFKPSQNSLDVRQSRKAFSYCVLFKSTIFSRYSSYIKLLRVTTWCLRFIWNADWLGPYLQGPLQSFELQQALCVLVVLVQKERFSDEIRALEANKDIDKKSSLCSLSPFLDAHGIIRVGGRLQSSNLSYEQRFPIILPSKHEFTKLIIAFEHDTNFHAGPQFLNSILRRKWWILQSNRAIKTCINSCLKCIRTKVETRYQKMASLPKARVVPGKVFQETGVDYAGPIKIIGKGGRHKVFYKAYIALFVCFATKAVHLELVSDMKTENFMAALTRFISRRGLPLKIHSDNGSTFSGARNELEDLKEFFQQNAESIYKFASLKGFQWCFIPPRAPHFGGLWEAGIKSVKSLLKRSLGDTVFTYIRNVFNSN